MHSQPEHAGNIKLAAVPLSPSPLHFHPTPPCPTLPSPIRLHPSHPTPLHGAATPPSINHIVIEWMMIGQAGAMMLLDLCLLPWPRRGPACLRLHALRLLTHTKLHRLLSTLASVAAYTKLRSWLAGDHLVRIYRKVCLSHSLQCFSTCCTASSVECSGIVVRQPFCAPMMLLVE